MPLTIEDQHMLLSEFPDYDQGNLPDLPDGFECVAYHNDVMPIWVNAAACIQIGIDYSDVALREDPNGKRFNAWTYAEDSHMDLEHCQTNDWPTALAFIARHTKGGAKFGGSGDPLGI